MEIITIDWHCFASSFCFFNPTGIRTINIMPDDAWTITRLNGTTVAKGKGVPDLNLPAGVYIIRQGNNVRKVIIK